MLKGEYAGKLFSGEKRATVRLGIVRVRRPEVIIHAGGRPVAKARIREIIRNLTKEFSVGIIYVTHDHKEAFELSDYIVVINHGEIVEKGTPSKLRESKDKFLKEFLSIY